ncbi:hypothetical protein [Moraxella caviae]|uniref:hypothetical protein n=1 Tax=Moraxella caviae TaxID=34060 RepID=UPI001A94FACA|nr:hypothetical protein [Moraxella caviae]
MGKLHLQGVTPDEFYQEILGSFLVCFPLDNAIIPTNHLLPREHKDPFDRLLIWQSIKQNLIFISQDDKNALYQKHGLIYIS